MRKQFSAYPPAVQRFFDACRTDNALGVRAYLTTPGVQDQWLSQGLERALQNQSEKALEMLCAHKDKHTTTTDPKWWSDFMGNIFSSGYSIRYLLSSPTTLSRLLAHCTVAPNLQKFAPTIAHEGPAEMVEAVLPYLSATQRDEMLQTVVCRRVHSEEAVALLLPVSDVEKVLEFTKTTVGSFFHTPNPAAVQQLSDHLLNKKLHAELAQTDHPEMSSKRRM